MRQLSLTEPNEAVICIRDAKGKAQFTCDEAFAHYLIWLSKGSDSHNFQQSIQHVLIYRDCLNQYGPLKLFNAQDKPDSGFNAAGQTGKVPIKKEIAIQQRERHGSEFCSVADSEVIPDVCNEFILCYLQARKKNGSNRKVAIPIRQYTARMTDRMCSWLYNEGYTSSRLVRRKSSSK